MDDAVRRALENDFTIDITTWGRTSGQPRRIEIWMLHIEGRFFITGTPRPRDWLANVMKRPELIVHLKQRVTADLAATVALVTDEPTRRFVLESGEAEWYRGQCPLDELLESAPTIELFFDA